MQQIIDFFILDPSVPIEFWAQIIGFIPLVLSLFTFALSKRGPILISKLFSDLSSGIHFFMLGEVVGGAVCVINTARGVVFYNRGKKWASGIWVPILFCILTLGSALIRWEGVYSLLPAVGSVLAVIGFWFSDPRLLKLFNLPAVILWLIYSIITGSISSTLINIISITTIIISLLSSVIKSHKMQHLSPSPAPANDEDARSA